MSEDRLPSDEELRFICLADVRCVPYQVFESVAAMGQSIASDWDLLALSDEDEEDEDEDLPCQLCDHSYAQKHRIIPGRWGGTYHTSNVIPLCPNHHAMIHLRMKYHKDSDSLTRGECERLDDAMHDPGINHLWASRVKRVSIQRLMDRGLYYKPEKAEARA